MLTEKIRTAIDGSVLCWLASSSKENVPNVSPKEAFAHYGDRYVLIANIASPQTIKNIRENPTICISFIDIFVQKGFQLKGVAELISRKNEEFDKLALPLKVIVGDAFPFSQIIKMEIEAIKPIIAPRYLLFRDTTEEQQIKSAMVSYGVQPSTKT